MLGPQQQFIVEMESEMFQAGAAVRAQLTGLPHQSAASASSNRALKDEERKEDVGQGDRLTAAKRSSGNNQIDMANNANLGALRKSIANGIGERSSSGRSSNKNSVKPLKGIYG